MSIPWISAVKRGRKLSVYLTPAARNAVWNHVLGHILDEFNALAKKHALGIQLTASGHAPTDGGGADVAISAAADKISLTFPGTAPVTEPFSEKGKHGRTLLLSRDGALFKAFVFLPGRPEINTPTGPRLVGSKVLALIALHELLHACGLENGDHAPSGVFQATPSVDLGDAAASDKTRVQPTVQRYMPPYVLDAATISALKTLWAP